jgi:hypothetical protein
MPVSVRARPRASDTMMPGDRYLFVIVDPTAARYRQRQYSRRVGRQVRQAVPGTVG